MAFLLLWAVPIASLGQENYDSPPINYSSHEPQDGVAKVKNALESGDLRLQWSERHGWLPAILEALAVSPETQTLVFSKTSLQFTKIWPAHPRAIYFQDDVYVGWVQGGDVIELAAVDPEIGPTFYRLRQQQTAPPQIERDHGDCLSCHQTSRTQSVPGFLVRSVFPEPSGQPSYQHGTTTTDHRTPLRDRFGGWYVTGRHGRMRHRGNVFVSSSELDPLDREAGANLTELPKLVAKGAYLRPHSDIVALMVLEHQSQLHNFVTKALYADRQAMHYQETMNEILGRPSGYRSDSTTRRIESAAEKLVEYLFFCDEYRLHSPIEGSDTFIQYFQSLGPHDSRGRSLRDFDLRMRMFRFPCSYLVYTDSFLALPESTKRYVKRRMLQILAGDDRSTRFTHLKSKHRADILAILRETHPWFRP